MRLSEYQSPIWGLIYVGDQTAGLFQGFETGLFNRMFHTIVLDRGPLWLDGFGTADQVEAFWMEMDARYPRRPLRRRRFVPETAQIVPYLSRRDDIKPYRTLWYDLAPDIEMLRRNLRGNWRGHLKTAEQNKNLKVRFDTRGDMTEWLLHVYGTDRRVRYYRGPDIGLTRALIESFAAGDGMAIVWVEDQGTPVAGLLVLCHGAAATWQIGWVGAAGRPVQANYMLLWETIKWLKSRGVGALDLGGVNDEDARGILDFKAGLNGTPHILYGQYA